MHFCTCWSLAWPFPAAWALPGTPKPTTGPGSGCKGGADPALPGVLGRASALAPQLPHLPPSLPLTLALPLPWSCGRRAAPSLLGQGIPGTWGGLLTVGYCAQIKAVCTFIMVLACILLPSVLLPSAGVATAELSPSPTAVAGGGCKGKAAPLPLPQPSGRAGMLKARGGSPFVAAFPFQGQQRATTKQRMPPLDPGNNAVAMDSCVSWGHGAGPAAPPVLWVSRVPPCGSGSLALPWGRRAVGCSESLWRVPLGAGRRAIYEVPCCPLLQHGRDKGMGSTDLGCRVNTGCWLLRHRLPAYPAARAAGGIRGPG